MTKLSKFGLNRPKNRLKWTQNASTISKSDPCRQCSSVLNLMLGCRGFSPSSVWAPKHPNFGCLGTRLLFSTFSLTLVARHYCSSWGDNPNNNFAFHPLSLIRLEGRLYKLSLILIWLKIFLINVESLNYNIKR